MSDSVTEVTIHLFCGGRLPLPLHQTLLMVERAGFKVDHEQAKVTVPDDWVPPSNLVWIGSEAWPA